MGKNYSDDNDGFQLEGCSNEYFVDIILVLADFYCVVNNAPPQQHANVCTMLANGLAPIFQINLPNHMSFEQFQHDYEDTDGVLPRRFLRCLHEFQSMPGAAILARANTQQNFDSICREIESRLVAQELVKAFLPLLKK
ncbi:hypothetical protein [Paraflavitalea sp. CAU 1676]|uniref:hypothetical protein n=1 Tax=Paraflavitalea sp. CAU 1676 TaxID=3032598 RepID=UPI0023DB74D9|nr:hypothetical protein [Paraflavitalea sp. CAU 1676]MDF2188709.1 hypothetical protein [Paraflavitalea sp. CAU 1676]